jgi:hypothetical protein
MANVDRLLNIDVFTDDNVEYQNGVTLSSAFPPDEHGPVPRIEVHNRNDPRARSPIASFWSTRPFSGLWTHRRSTGSTTRRS